MKFKTLILLALLSPAAYSQIFFGTSHEYEKAKIFRKINDNHHNNILSRDPKKGFAQCKTDHTVILNLVQNKYKNQLGLIVKGISTSSGAKQNRLYDQLLDRLTHVIILEEMKKELKRADLKSITYSNKKAFSMTFKNVDFDGYVSKLIDDAASFKGLNTISGATKKMIKVEIMQSIGSELATTAFTQIANGVRLEIAKSVLATGSSEVVKQGLKSAVIKFSGNVLASAGRGLLISLLTAPLKGGRLPPETLWLDLLHEHPGVIINPELMAQAKIKDDPWFTHCNTINRRAYSVERVLAKLLKDIDSEIKL